MKLLVWLLVNALALGAAVLLFAGITLRQGTDTQVVLELVVVGAVFGAITAVVRPVVRFLSLPLIVLTLGLALLVINALMLLLTSAISGSLGLGFHVDGFWTALGGSIVISLASMVLHAVLPDTDRRRRR
ncbi:MAG: phage holin family protein [Marmoricola sp.]|nr:phage holin family protein [Marmoricola sp.]